MASVEKTYADAMFTLLQDDGAERTVFDTVLSQLKVVGDSIAATPDLLKLMSTPTVSDDEKLGVIDAVFAGRATPYVHNFLRLIAVKKRMSCYLRILDAFRERYNEHFGVADITVTSAFPLSEAALSKIALKMQGITGKTVSLTTNVDKTLIGGVVVDYGNTRLDGSVKTRLDELSKNIANTVA
jgi:F-type H+-transporting ATPase subunit delta